MKLINIKIKELLTSDTKLTFLIGAGCSVDSPSCLPAGRSMMDTIINYVCTKMEIENIKKVEEVRFEALVEIVRDLLDPELRIIDYYGLCDRPNIQHFFLADMIKKGNFVMTTNFDFLIEYALIQSGVPKNDIISVITKENYEEYDNPSNLIKLGKKPLFKLHGSTKNIVTGVSTKDSLVSTIKALGLNKEGLNIFEIEPYKRFIFKSITSGRNLIIMGYSGTDDFDIIPTLKVLKNLKNLIWINHVDESESIEIHEINLEKDSVHENLDKILIDIKQGAQIDNVYRVDVNTSNLIENLIDNLPNISSVPFKIKPLDWLRENIRKPDRFEEYYIPSKIYLDIHDYEGARKCSEILLTNSEKNGNLSWKSLALISLGCIYYELGEYDQAKLQYKEALRIAQNLGDLRDIAAALNGIALIMHETDNVDDALNFYQIVLETEEEIGNLHGISVALTAIGAILRDKGKLDEALVHFNKALKIIEEIGDLRERGSILTNIGKVSEYKGLLDEALQHYQVALEIDIPMEGANMIKYIID